MANSDATARMTATRSSSVRSRLPGMRSLLAALLLTGCASTRDIQALDHMQRLDSPPQHGRALLGWAFFLPGAPHMTFIGITSRGLCEAIREKTVKDTPHAKPSPCVPVKVTAD